MDKPSTTKRLAHFAPNILEILEGSLPILRSGLTSRSAGRLHNLLADNLEFDAIIITDRQKILASGGAGVEHHQSGDYIKTLGVTPGALQTRMVTVAQNRTALGCIHRACILSSGVVAPLLVFDEPVGSLGLFFLGENAIHPDHELLVKRLSSFLSSQLETSEVYRQRREALEAHVHALRARMEPHFIFNALNSIGTLCLTDSDAAHEMAIKLASLLRRVFRTHGHLVNLHTELKIVRDYIAISKLRFPDQFEYREMVEFGSLTFFVPIFSLQILVENAIVHRDHLEKNIITLTTSVRGNFLEITVTNSDSHPSDLTIATMLTMHDNELRPSRTLATLRYRLNALFGSKVRFGAFNTDSGFCIQVSIPLVESPLLRIP